MNTAAGQTHQIRHKHAERSEIKKKMLQLLSLMNVRNVNLFIPFSSAYLDEINGTKPNWFSKDALGLLNASSQ